MDELKKKFEEFSAAIAEMRKANDERLKALESKGSVDPLLTEKVEKANAHVAKLEAQIEEMKTAMNRTGGAGGQTDEQKQKAQDLAVKAAYDKYMRKGDRHMSVEEFKLLSTDSNPDGGFLVRPELSAMVVKHVFESSPMREISGSQTIGTNTLDILQDLDESASGWTGENGARTATGTPKIKMVSIPTHELYASPTATQTSLDDAAWNLEAWLAAKVSDKFGRDEATAFVGGNGVNKPRGFLSYASGTSFGQVEQKVSGNATLLTADGLFDLQVSLKEPYQANASWLFQRITVGSIRKLKDGQGRYIWQPGLTEDAPAMVLGRPYRMAADMPAEGAGNLAAAYGDFKQGYLIVDRVGIRVLRDPFTSKPNVIFYTTKRVGGDVVNFEAIKLGKCST